MPGEPGQPTLPSTPLPGKGRPDCLADCHLRGDRLAASTALFMA
jgi:hypothetical protein